MKYLKSYLEVNESKLPTHNINKHNINLLSQHKRKYLEDEELIDKVYLSGYDKLIKIEWNDRLDHELLPRILKRTSIKSNSELNQAVSDGLKGMFEKDFDKISELGKDLTNRQRKWESIDISLFLKKKSFYLILRFKYDNLFEEDTTLRIVTLLSDTPKKHCSAYLEI